MKQYRIGDFARYLGVTPDLLKHYEECGLITPTRSESGYRYYPFHTSMLLIESVRLRNYGLTLREITDILVRHKADNAFMENRLAGNMRLLKEECRLNQMLIEDYEEFLQWKEPLEHMETDWCIRRSRPMCFLPHTDSYEFLKDPRIYEILKDWMSHIPIVKSAMRLQPDGTVSWGLLVEKKKLQQLQLPVNGVVIEIPSRKVFYYQFRDLLPQLTQEQPTPDANPALAVMHGMHLQADGDIYRTTLCPSSWQKDIRYQYGYYAVPLKEGTDAGSPSE